MTQTNHDDLATVEAPPVARTRRRRWTVYLVWLVPLVAAAVAAYLVNDRIHQFGPTITITFQDGTGLKPGQSEIRHRGVSVAEVSALRLSDDRAHVVVSARVRPEVGIETVRGLGTVITGPYIDISPGSGPPRTDFDGVERPSPTLGRKGPHLTLATPQLSS